MITKAFQNIQSESEEKEIANEILESLKLISMSLLQFQSQLQLNSKPFLQEL